jgi:hypothetical protein
MVLVSDKPISPIVLAGLIVMAMHFLHTGRKRATLPGAEESMTTTIDFITALFCQVDDHLSGLPKHPEAHLWPSEVVTLGLLHALKGVGNRLLSLVDARLSGAVSPPPRAHPALSPLPDPSGLDAGFLGRPDHARRHRRVWHRVDPSDARRPHAPADWPQRPLESSVDCRRQTLSAAQSVGSATQVMLMTRFRVVLHR